MASSKANGALKQVWKILEDAINHSTNYNQAIPSSASLYNFFEDWCDRAFECGEMTREEVDLVLGMSQMWGAYVGDDVKLQSLKYFYLEDCIEGGRLRIRDLIEENSFLQRTASYQPTTRKSLPRFLQFLLQKHESNIRLS